MEINTHNQQQALLHEHSLTFIKSQADLTLPTHMERKHSAEVVGKGKKGESMGRRKGRYESSDGRGGQLKIKLKPKVVGVI